jgi:hypothetical protein
MKSTKLFAFGTLVLLATLALAGGQFNSQVFSHCTWTDFRGAGQGWDLPAQTTTLPALMKWGC